MALARLPTGMPEEPKDKRIDDSGLGYQSHQSVVETRFQSFNLPNTISAPPVPWVPIVPVVQNVQADPSDQNW
jgi:hypothetical protein